MRTLAASILLFIASHALAFDALTERDYYREAVLGSLMILDCAQTKNILHSQTPYIQQHNEANPIIQRHFTDAGIRNYFIVTFAAHAAITAALPADYRPYWQYGAIALEVAVIAKNKRLGIKFDF